MEWIETTFTSLMKLVPLTIQANPFCTIVCINSIELQSAIVVERVRD